jgi:Tol biopolymer transport system component
MRPDSIPPHPAVLATLALLAACAPSPEDAALPVVLREHPSVPHAALSFDGERRLERITQLTFGGRVSSAAFDLNAGQIVYDDVRDGRCPQVFVMDSDGRNARVASSGDGRARGAAFLPRADRIAFASTHAASTSCPSFFGAGRHLPPSSDLFTSGYDGQQLRALVSHPGFDGDLSVSLAGDLFAFASTRSGDLEVYTGRVDDPTRAERVTKMPGYDAEPALAPDGSAVAWVNGQPPEDPGAYAAALARGDSGGGLTRLALWVIKSDGPTTLTGFGDVSNPTFDPTGQHVLFSARLDDATRGRDIYMVRDARAASRFVERVTFHPADDVAAALSADGRRVVFVSGRNASHPDELNVFVADWLDAPRGPEASLRGQARIDPKTLAARASKLAAPDAPGLRALGSASLAQAESRFEEQLRVAGARPAPGRDALSIPYRYEVAPAAPDPDPAAQDAPVEAPEPEDPDAAPAEPPAPTVSTGAHQLGYLAASTDGPSPESILVMVRLDDPRGASAKPDDAATAWAASAAVEALEALAGVPRGRDVYVLGYVPAPGSDAPPARLLVALEGAGLAAALHVDASADGLARTWGARSGWTFTEALRRAQSGLNVPLAFDPPPSAAPGGSLDTLHAREVPAMRLWLPTDAPDRADSAALLFRLLRELADAPHAPAFSNPLQATLRQRAAREARTARPSAAAAAAERAHSGGYGTYLGTVPGFAKDQAGALVREVQPGSPAATAGVLPGDLIVALDGQPIADLRALAAALRAHEPGDTVPIVVERGGSRITLNATLEEPR